MDQSALRNVFGSSASLAELSGDDVSGNQKKLGYSRFGLNEHPPAHQMHTKVRRLSTMSRSDRPFVLPPRRHRWYISVPSLLIFGCLQSLLMHAHLPLSVKPTATQRLELLAAGSVLSLIVGYLVPATDSDKLEVDREGSGSNGKWKTALVRSYGALLGLVYLTEKLPQDAVLAWVLIAPSLWYIGDNTLNGFLIGVAVATAGSLAMLYEFPELLNNTCKDLLVAISATATAYFGTSLVAGNVGRGLRK